METLEGVGVLLLVLTIFIWGPTRKAIGLVTVILGVFACTTLVGAIIGIPMILVGGFLLFV